MSRRGAARWTIAPAAVATAIGFAMTIGARLLVREGGDPRIAVVLGVIALNLATVGVVMVFAALHDRPRPADFGLERPAPWRAVALVFLVGLASLVVTVLWVAAFQVEVGDETANPSVTERFAADRGALNALLALFLVAVASPLSEEFLFRGYLFRTLRNRTGLWPAAVASSGVFAATHLGWVPTVMVVPIGIAGILFCLLYRWTGSLYPPLGAHALLNSVSFGAEMGWTWQAPLAMAAAVAATLGIAWLIALGLSRRAGGPETSRPARPLATRDQ